MKQAMLKIVGCGLLSALCIQLARAQEQAQPQKPPLPAGPLLKSPASYSTWLIKYRYTAESDKKDAELEPPPPLPRADGSVSLAPIRRVTITRTGAITHVVTLDIAGYKMDQWVTSQDALFVADGLSEVGRVPSGAIQEYLGNYAASAFPDMGFISPETYVGVQTLGNITCLVFVQSDTTAWVNADTRYPVAWRKGAVTRTFKELDPPQSMQKLPQKFQEASESIKATNKYLKRPIPVGG